MKSSHSELKSRGYICEEDMFKYKDLAKEELLELLKSKEPYKRTVSVRLLGIKEVLNRDMITLFSQMLLKEKKLYTKLEIFIRTMSSFKTERVIDILKTIENEDDREIIRKEAKRSIIYGKI